jgi:glucokinase
MAVIGMDLGGTKLASAVFSERGTILTKSHVALNDRRGAEVGDLICEEIHRMLPFAGADDPVRAVGVCVPGIYYAKNGHVWAPNIPDWDDYPLQGELSAAVGDSISVRVDSDRACAILGETWKGTARGSKDAIFIAVGTGIGAGILVNGRVLRGHADIGGAVGWLALSRPFRESYANCGDFEYNASGPGLAKVAQDLLAAHPDRPSVLHAVKGPITARHIFHAHAKGDSIAADVLNNAVEYWGKAVANLVSLFNPDKIIFGGGVFGPAASLIDRIRAEAELWAQPISMKQVSLEVSTLGGDAQLYGAGRLALKVRAARPKRVAVG